MTQAVHVSSKSVQTYTAPMSFVNLCAERFGVNFVLDLAADASNARCNIFYDEKENALKQDWHSGLLRAATIEDAEMKRVAAWNNPPYRITPAFMRKCSEESQRGCKIVTLTLASLGTKWYKSYVKPFAASYILEDRITFDGQKDPFPKELMVSLFGFGMTGLCWWNWKKDVA